MGEDIDLSGMDCVQILRSSCAWPWCKKTLHVCLAGILVHLLLIRLGRGCPNGKGCQVEQISNCGKMSGEGKTIVTKLVSNYRRDSKRKLDKESMDR